MKRMKYSLWTQYYRQFPASQYDQATKTILVDIPDERRKPFPKDWRRSGGQRYFTPGGCEVDCWNTGFAENFVVRMVVRNEVYSKTIHPGIDSRDRVIQAVSILEGLRR